MLAKNHLEQDLILEGDILNRSIQELVQESVLQGRPGWEEHDSARLCKCQSCHDIRNPNHPVQIHVASPNWVKPATRMETYQLQIDSKHMKTHGNHTKFYSKC